MENDKNQSTQKLHFSTRINAPKEKVWDIMLNDESYQEWSSAFMEGSHFKGSWEEGSEIQFLDPNGMGMLGEIAENKPYEFVSVEITGFVNEGEKDTESEGAKAMAGTLENYTFKEIDGITEVSVDTGTTEEYKAMFEEAWPKALAKLKELAEK